MLLASRYHDDASVPRSKASRPIPSSVSARFPRSFGQGGCATRSSICGQMRCAVPLSGLYEVQLPSSCKETTRSGKPMTEFTNEYCMHTATCGELRKDDCGREVTLTGWAWHNRDHGGLIFIDLRDHSGILQLPYGNKAVYRISRKSAD